MQQYILNKIGRSMVTFDEKFRRQDLKKSKWFYESFWAI